MNTTTSTLREILRERPLAVSLFEDQAGYGFWNHLDLQFPHFCHILKLDERGLAANIAGLPEEQATGGWTAKPLYCLADHLTANHREFRAKDLPQMQRLFELIRLEFPNESGTIDAFLAEYRSFRQELSWHMNEEEEFLFPKILRTEASLRHPELYPEIYKGSVNMFPKNQLHVPEEAFRDMLAELTAKFKELVTDLHQLPVVREILSVLQTFAMKLKAHTYLEAEVLFPRAAEMENRLASREIKAGWADPV